MARGDGGRTDHLGALAVSVAVASAALWGHWFTYVELGLRWRLPNWVLTQERLFFALYWIMVLAGVLVTVYQARLLLRGERPEGGDSPHRAG